MPKIIKKGRDGPRWIGKVVTCSSCECEFKLMKGDNLKLEPDQREGDYYTIRCPNATCGHLVTVSAELLR